MVEVQESAMPALDWARSVDLAPNLRSCERHHPDSPCEPMQRELFPNRHPHDACRSGEPLATALIASGPMQRLKGIGFLGAIDYARHGNGSMKNRRRHYRFEHSIAVARLANIYALAAELSERRRLTLLSAALLHDVGHGPLSHSLEPVFELKFGINHHSMTRSIILGETEWGSVISNLLKQVSVDVDEVLELIEKRHKGKDIGFLFSAPINLDTLDGITRCRAIMMPESVSISAESIVYEWATGSCLPQEKFDKFWKLKHTMYNLFLGNRRYVVLDALVQAYMHSNLSKFSPEDFILPTKKFREQHRSLFEKIECMAKTITGDSCNIPQEWLNQKIKLKTRRFFIETDVVLEGSASMSGRYLQSKEIKTISLRDLLHET